MERDWEEEKKKFNEKIGNNLKIAIKKAGLRQKDFAPMLGVTDSTIVRWVNNKVTPDLFYLYKTSILLDIKLETLLEGYISTDLSGFFTPEEVKKLKGLITK